MLTEGDKKNLRGTTVDSWVLGIGLMRSKPGQDGEEIIGQYK